MSGVPVRHQRAVVADDRILVPEAGTAQADAAGVHVQDVVEDRGNDVPAERLENERFDPVVA